MYLADIHRLDYKGTRLLLNVESSSLYRIDNLTDDVLSCLAVENHPTDLKPVEDKYGVEAVQQVLTDLEAAGLLRDKQQRQNEVIPEEQCNITNLALNVSHRCNMRCRYCYGDGGSYGMKSDQMPVSVALAAVDMLMRESGESKRCSIMFFGGEPLLNTNTIESCVEYGLKKAKKHGKRLTFSTVTNGTLLSDDMLDFLDRNRIWAEISIDGPKSINDSMRVFGSGKGSYDKIVDGAQRLFARRPNMVPARATVTHEAPEFLESVKHILQLGFGSVAVDLVSGDGSEWGLNDDDLSIVEDQYEKAADYLIKRLKNGDRFEFSSLTEIVELMLCPEKRIYHCGCGKSYLAVAPAGDIYACHRFVGDWRFRMGNVFVNIDRDVRRRFLHNSVENREDCRNCWARYICGGGCNYQAVLATGGIVKPDSRRCGITRKIIELGMIVFWELNQENKPILDRAAELVRHRRAYRDIVR